MDHVTHDLNRYHHVLDRGTEELEIRERLIRDEVLEGEWDDSVIDNFCGDCNEDYCDWAEELEHDEELVQIARGMYAVQIAEQVVWG